MYNMTDSKWESYMRRFLFVGLAVLLFACGKAKTDSKAPYVVIVSKNQRVKSFWKKHKRVLDSVLSKLEQIRSRCERIKKTDQNYLKNFKLEIGNILHPLTVSQLEFVYLVFEDPMGKVSRMIHDRIAEYWKKKVRLSVRGRIRCSAQVWLFLTRKGSKGKGVYADDSLHFREFIKRNEICKLMKTDQLEFLYPRSGSVELYTCRDRLSWKTVYRVKLRPKVQGRIWNSRAAKVSELKGSTFFLWYRGTNEFYWKKLLWVTEKQQ